MAPALGTAIRHEFQLDPDFLTVNHGSYGATSRCVLAAQRGWQERLEAQPVRFLHRELPPLLRAAAAGLAAFVGARGDDLVFVANATAGYNAVLRSFRFAPGDQILLLDHGYPAVRSVARFVAERTGAEIVTAALPFPPPDDDAIIAAVAAALTERTRIAVIDHITSPSALILPVARLATLCRAAGAKILVDGAHAPGQIALNVPALGADYYTGNCHKWLMAPKGCAFLWASRESQADLHPTTISHGFGRKSFLAAFDWTGTRDPSAYLSVGAALDFHAGLGGPVLMARNAALADEGAALLAAKLGVPDLTMSGFTAAMRVIKLPGAPAQTADPEPLRERLLDAGTDAPPVAIGGALWVRISAQAYNDINDYARLAEILTAVLTA